MDVSTLDIDNIIELIKDPDFIQGISPSELQNLERLVEEYTNANKFYKIKDFKPTEKQQIAFDAISKATLGNSALDWFIIHGGTRGGKSLIIVYIIILLALGKDCHKYGLPYIGERKRINVYTKTGQNLADVMYPYFLGDSSLTRIPLDALDGRPILDRGRIRSIKFKSGCKISFLTYDQGFENLQGSSPDLIWMDEDATDRKVFDQIYARAQSPGCISFVTLNPDGNKNGVYDTLIDSPDKEWKKVHVFELHIFGALDNKYVKQDTMGGMSEAMKQIKIYGSWTPVEGLVYANFTEGNILRDENNIPIHIEPTFKNLGPVEYYYGIDPGASHPTGVTGLARTQDGLWYQFSERLFKYNEPVKIVAAYLHELFRKYPPRAVIVDSQAKGYRIELKEHGIMTDAADKRSKLGKDENREAGIRYINELLHSGKFFISAKCTETKKQFQSHYYKQSSNAKDGGVHKENDDLLDPVRYCISNIDLWEKKRIERSQKTKENQMAANGRYRDKNRNYVSKYL